MRMQAVCGAAAEIRADVLVVGVFQGDEKNAFELTQAAQTIDTAASGLIGKVLKAGEFSPETGAVEVLYEVSCAAADRVVLLGLGKKKTFNERAFVKALEAFAKSTKAQTVALAAADWSIEGRDELWAARTAARVMASASFEPAPVKKDGDAKHGPQALFWITGADVEGVERELEAGRVFAEALNWARELAQLPPNVCDPQFVGEAAESIEKGGKHVSCTVWGREEIEKRGMGGLLAVSQGSAVEPVFIELTYRGAAKNEAPVVLVGKGITFDAGGISLKPGRNMDAMKFDMCGASVVLAAVKAAAALELPLNVTALVPCCENLPSGSAVNPSDVITISDGTTVEVLNTDAEGRLILADALVRARALKPAVCIDVATLTGACIVALGSDISGLFVNGRELRTALCDAADSAVDPVWPMPYNGLYKELMKSSSADLANIGSRPEAGACTAATFLAHFAPDCPWAHLDVAGTANTSGAKKVSTGRPLPLILEWLYERTRAVRTAAAEAKAVKDKKTGKKTSKVKNG